MQAKLTIHSTGIIIATMVVRFTQPSGDRKSMNRVLFIRSQNRLRGPTAGQVFATWPGIETASAGLNNDAETPVALARPVSDR